MGTEGYTFHPARPSKAQGGTGVPAVSAAAVDVIAIMSISLTAARFLSNGSQDRVVSVPKELTEERHIVRRGDELQAGMAAFAG